MKGQSLDRTFSSFGESSVSGPPLEIGGYVFESSSPVGLLIRVILPPVRLLRLGVLTLLQQTPLNFDRAHKVDTGYAFGRNRGITDGPLGYEACSQKHLHFAIGLIPKPLENWSFVDIGAGKGRAVLIALGYPFRSVSGIEFDPELHAIALSNLKSFQGMKRARQISFSCEDALTAQLPDDDVVIFFYNSFRGEMLEIFLNRLEDIARVGQRRLLLIYSNPTESERLKRRPLFRTVFTGASPIDLVDWGMRRLEIFEIG